MEKYTYDTLWKRPNDVLLSGRDCVIGIIDQPSWLGQPAYSKNILRQFQINDTPFAGEYADEAAMHGAAVLSIATGKIGIAPNANVVYCGIETYYGRGLLLQNHAKALRQLRAYFEDGNRLDTISTSHGWKGDEPGAGENDDLVDWFEKHNVPVFSTNDPIIYPIGPRGLAENWRSNASPPKIRQGQIAIPVDERLIACRNRHDINAYGDLYYRVSQGGASWAVPFVAGFFALAREANPQITRRDFEHALLDTAHEIIFGPKYRIPVPDIEAFSKSLSARRPTPLPNPHHNIAKLSS